MLDGKRVASICDMVNTFETMEFDGLESWRRRRSNCRVRYMGVPELGKIEWKQETGSSYASRRGVSTQQCGLDLIALSEAYVINAIDFYLEDISNETSSNNQNTHLMHWNQRIREKGAREEGGEKEGGEKEGGENGGRQEESGSHTETRARGEERRNNVEVRAMVRAVIVEGVWVEEHEIGLMDVPLDFHGNNTTPANNDFERWSDSE
ncbi:hypothetical protein C8R48DRAFT_671808 [Suillus tomentosus]|nr:hypothetical protein C8R48DRAFT_671808 [Suillus tomentosus]